jgi:hypothetical protein
MTIRDTSTASSKALMSRYGLWSWALIPSEAPGYRIQFINQNCYTALERTTQNFVLFQDDPRRLYEPYLLKPGIFSGSLLECGIAILAPVEVHTHSLPMAERAKGTAILDPDSW